MVYETENIVECNQETEPVHEDNMMEEDTSLSSDTSSVKPNVTKPKEVKFETQIINTNCEILLMYLHIWENLSQIHDTTYQRGGNFSQCP